MFFSSVNKPETGAIDTVEFIEKEKGEKIMPITENTKITTVHNNVK